jgi:hypothetical protein
MNNTSHDNADGRLCPMRRRPGPCSSILAAVSLLACSISATAQDATTEPRPAAPGGAARQLTGTIESAGPGGVVFREGEGTSASRTVVALDLLRTIPPVANSVPSGLDQLALDVWRARQRLERGDFQAAEPVLDRLASAVIPAGGPTGALVAEGLLTCRLSRDARTAALFSWLDWLRIVRAGPGIPDAPAGSLVAPPAVITTLWEGGRLAPRVGSSPIDRTSGLVPELPPIWVPGAATEALAASPEWDRIRALASAEGSPRDPIIELAMLYLASVEADCGRTPTLPPRSSAFEGVGLVRDMVTARTADEAARATARDALAARLAAADVSRWKEAWCRAGIGRSLVIEADAATNRRGVLELLHIPARFPRDQRHLAAVALAESAITLARIGDSAGAAILRAELARAFPDHPAGRWVDASQASGSAPLSLHGAIVAASVATFTPAQPVDFEAESAVPVGPDDALEAYLVRLELTTLLAEHLEARLAELPRDKRGPVAERLAKLYVRLLEAASTTESRRQWETKADTLLREVPEAEGFELRISLSRALYVRAEDICERNRLRLATEDEVAEADRVLRQLEPQLREIAVKVHRRVDALERIEKQGDATDELNQQLADARRIRSLAFYYSGWCSYYLALLTQSEPAAIDAFKSFGWLLNSPNGRLATLDRIPTALLRYEHVARAAMGCALAASARGNDIEAMSWIEAIEEADEVPEPVRNQLLLRKIGILGSAKRWADLERTVRLARNSDRSGGGDNLRHLQTTEARLLAVVALEADRRVAASSIESLAKIALGDLIAKGEIAQVLNLVDMFGTAPIGETGFVVHYVRAVKAYDEARDAHKAAGGDPEEPATADNVLNLYRAASGLLEAALGQSDAQSFKPERVRAAMFAARASFFAGDFVSAANGFHRAWEIATSVDRTSPDAEEALWLCVVSLDRAASRPGAAAELASRRSQTGALFLQSYPDSPRAARLLLMRAAAGDVSDDEALRVLEGVAKDSPMYEAARRQVARILYNRYRISTGNERDFAAMKFITIGEELLAIDRRAATQVAGQNTEAAERAIVRCRQLLDALLGVSSPNADRAQSTLELCRTLASMTGISLQEHEAELLYRELQIALARGRDDLARAAARGLNDLPSAQREFAPAAERLLYRSALTRFRSLRTDAEKNESARDIVDFGVRIIDRIGVAGSPASDTTLLGVQSTVADAAFHLWRSSGGTETGGGDEAMRDLSLRLDKLVLKAAPNTADALRRVAVTAEASDDDRLSLECWSLLLAAAQSGSDQWFEARYNALRLISRLEPARARDLLAQHRALFPTYGPPPWGDRIRELDESGSAAPRPGDSSPTPAQPAPGPQGER